MPDLTVPVELDDDTASAGDNLYGAAHLSNLGRGRIAFVTGAVLGAIRTEHGACLAGDFADSIAPVGIVVDLGAAETRELHVLVGTRSCGPDTVVSPGATRPSSGSRSPFKTRRGLPRLTTSSYGQGP